MHVGVEDAPRGESNAVSALNISRHFKDAKFASVGSVCVTEALGLNRSGLRPASGQRFLFPPTGRFEPAPGKTDRLS